MSTQDHKTKDFLEKIDYLVEKGIIKNPQEVVNTLEWNKSVMSSVRNGVLLVPQHIYNKFKEVYADHFSTDEGGYKDKYIALLEKQGKDQEEIFKRLTEVEKVLAEARRNQHVMYAFQKAFQEIALPLLPGYQKNTKKEFGEKAVAYLKKFLQEGIQI